MMHPQTKDNFCRYRLDGWFVVILMSSTPILVVFSGGWEASVFLKLASFSGVLIVLFVLGKTLIRPALRRRRDRKLVKAALSGYTPVDGERGAFFGVINADEPLAAPLSNHPCIAFDYHVYHLTLRDNISDSTTKKRMRTETYYYSGYHLADSEIVTSQATLKLFGYPLIHNASETAGTLDPERDAADKLLDATQYERIKLRAAIKRLRKDKNSIISEDWWIRDTPEQVAASTKWLKPSTQSVGKELSVIENILPVDTEVCVIGTFHANPGNLTPGDSPEEQVRIIPGGGQQALSALGIGSVFKFWK